MAKTIELHTRLDSGIYKSSGGGEDITVKSWAAGPRNLLTAIAALRQERKENIAGYGNIGCGASWLEIGGVVVQGLDLDMVDEDPDTTLEYTKADSRTQKARDFIEFVISGRYAEHLKMIAEEEAKESAEFYAQY